MTSMPPETDSTRSHTDDSVHPKPGEGPILVVRNLAHSFKGHHALKGVSFVVERGSIHGFVGPNGAGKTTTLKSIATLLKPNKGTAYVDGSSVLADVHRARRKIGYMPDHFAMYKRMKVVEYLDFFAAAYGQNLTTRQRTVQDVLELTDMAGRAESLIQGLSRGMQQRVSLARVLVHDPDLLLLDEPASGLDPRARIELMEILRELARMGKSIFISSHILSELATLCDAVTIIDRGEVRFSGAMDDLLDSGDGAITFDLQLHDPVEGLPERLTALPEVDHAAIAGEDPRRLQVVMAAGETKATAVLKILMESGADLVHLERTKQHLDQVFMDLTSPGVRD